MSNLDHAVREYLALLALSVGFRLLAASTDDDARPGSPRRRPVQSHLVTVGLSRLVSFTGRFSVPAVLARERRALPPTQGIGLS